MKIALVVGGGFLALWGIMDYMQMNNMLPAGNLLQTMQTTPSPPGGDALAVLGGGALVLWALSR